MVSSRTVPDDDSPVPRRGVVALGARFKRQDEMDFMSKSSIRILCEDESTLFEPDKKNETLEHGMPHFKTEKSSFFPKLRVLAERFGLELPSQMRTAADELEFFTSVHAAFRTVVQQQNSELHLVTGRGTGQRQKERTRLRETDWQIPASAIHSDQVEAVRSFALLKERCCLDPVLESSSEFLKIESAPKITAWLRKQIEELTRASKTCLSSDSPHSVSDHTPKNLSKRRKQDILRGAWERVYEAITHQDDSSLLEKGDYVRNQQQQEQRQESSYDFIRSYQMLGLADGSEQDMIVKSAQKDPSIASGALLSFLHLRHIDIRRSKLACLHHLNYLYSAQRSTTILQQVAEVCQTSKLEELNLDLDFYERVDMQGATTMKVKDSSGQAAIYTATVDKFSELENLILLLASAFSLKDEGFVDHIELLSNVWSGVEQVLGEKCRHAELILEAVFNATQDSAISELSDRIGLLLNFDFAHDTSQSHCVLHLSRHAALLQSQTRLLLALRAEAIYELRKLSSGDEREYERLLGPRVEIVSSFENGNRLSLHLCEVNPFLAHAFHVVDRVSQVVAVRDNGEQCHPASPLKAVNKLVEITDDALHFVETSATNMLDEKVAFSAQIQKDFLHPAVFVDELECETREMSVADLTSLFHVFTCFYHLKSDLVQTNIANGIYAGLCDTLGFSRSHLFLRLVQPSLSSDASSRPETQSRPNRPVPVDDRAVDRFRPPSYNLAVQDYDELVAKGLSFKDSSSIVELAMNPRKVERLALVARVQLLHRQLLQSCIRCASLVATWPFDQSASSSAELSSAKDTATVATSVMQGEKSQHYFSECFVSLQWERAWPRAKYLEFFESSMGQGSNVDKVGTNYK